MVTKSEFMRRKKIAALPAAERERRWKQHLASSDQPKQQQQPSRQQSQKQHHPMLSPSDQCVEHYALALVNPFDTPAGACVPRWPSLQSYKTKLFARGTGAIGTANIGFILGRPDFANNSSCVAVTDAAFTGTALATSGTGVNTTQNNSPYLSSELTSDAVNARVVAWGMRVRYTGTLLNQSGRAVALEEPDHQSLIPRTIDGLLVYDKAKSARFDDKWISVVYQPVRSNELEYASSANVGSGAFYSAIMMNGVPGQTFEWEYYLHCEMIGTIVRGKTITHADSAGFTRVVESTSQMSTLTIDKLTNDFKSAYQYASGIVRGTAKVVGAASAIYNAASPLLLTM